MPPKGSKGSKTSNVKRTLDKSEGRLLPGAKDAGHARGKHAEASPADMKKRILKDKNNLITTFKSPGDQDKAVAAALKTQDGLAILNKSREMKSGRLTLRTKVTGSFSCKVAYPYTREDGTKDVYTVDGKVREVMLVIDVKGGKIHIQTAYPSGFHLT